MTKVLDNAYIGLLARIVLGALFIVASIDKLSDPIAFAASIGAYKLLPHTITFVIATVLPWMEFICGACLVLGLLRRGAGLLLFGLLVVFTVAVIAALVRGLDISCGCFTQDPDAAKVGWWKIIENVGLTCLSLLVTLAQNSWLSIDNVINRRVST